MTLRSRPMSSSTSPLEALRARAREAFEAELFSSSELLCSFVVSAAAAAKEPPRQRAADLALYADTLVALGCAPALAPARHLGSAR